MAKKPLDWEVSIVSLETDNEKVNISLGNESYFITVNKDWRVIRSFPTTVSKREYFLFKFNPTYKTGIEFIAILGPACIKISSHYPSLGDSRIITTPLTILEAVEEAKKVIKRQSHEGSPYF